MPLNENIPPEIKAAAIEAMTILVKASRPDWTSRIYKKYVRVSRQGRIFTARKCALKMGVEPGEINAILTLLDIPYA